MVAYTCPRLLWTKDQTEAMHAVAPPAAYAAALAPAAPVAAPAAASAAAPAAPKEDKSSSGVEMLAPMSGTMYRKPAPGEPQFVKEGDKVVVGQSLCIIEVRCLSFQTSELMSRSD